MDTLDRQCSQCPDLAVPANPAAGAKRTYVKPEVHRLGNLASVQGTFWGNTYDGVYTTRSWWYTKG